MMKQGTLSLVWLVPLVLSFALAACGGSTIHSATPDVDAPSDTSVPQPDADATPQDTKPGPPDTAPTDTTDVQETGETVVPPPDTIPPPDATPSDCPVDELYPLLDDALDWLERGQSQQALVLYREAEALCPDDPTARFGHALSLMVDTVEFGLMLMSLTGQLSLNKSGGIEPEDSQDEWLAEKLHWAFAGLAGRFRESLIRLDGLAEEDPQFAFPARQVAVYNVTEPLVVYRGAFDMGDIHLMRLVAQNLILVLDILATQELRAELMTLVAELRGGNLGGVQGALSILGRLLAGNERFLTVHATEGVAAYEEAGRMLAAMDSTLAAALEWMRAEAEGEETDAPQVSVLRTFGANEVLELSLGFEDDPAVLRMPIPPQFSLALARMADSVAQPGTLVAWGEGPAWLLGGWLTVALRFGLVNDLLEGVLPIPLDNMNIQTAAGLLQTLTPFPFAFDFGTMFANPAVGLRSFLPLPNETGDGILISWECPEETADDRLPSGPGSLLCRTATEDRAHFVGTPAETVPDGVMSTFPYLGFSDPTLNGLLHVDAHALGLSETQGFLPADATSVNAGLAKGLQPILNLLGN